MQYFFLFRIFGVMCFFLGNFHHMPTLPIITTTSSKPAARLTNAHSSSSSAKARKSQAECSDVSLQLPVITNEKSSSVVLEATPIALDQKHRTMCDEIASSRQLPDKFVHFKWMPRDKLICDNPSAKRDISSCYAPKPLAH